MGAFRMARRLVVPTMIGALALTAVPAASEDVTVPNVRGMSIANARTNLAAAGITRVNVAWNVRPGSTRRVVSQMPPAGISIDNANGAVIWVSTGLQATGRRGKEFRTPGGAAYCQIDDSAELDVQLVCWTPNDGYTISLMVSEVPRPRARTDRRARGVKPAGFPTVAFGRTWTYRLGTKRIVCRSQATGLTCTNAARGGFWLGRGRGVRVWGARF